MGTLSLAVLHLLRFISCQARRTAKVRGKAPRVAEKATTIGDLSLATSPGGRRMASNGKHPLLHPHGIASGDEGTRVVASIRVLHSSTVAVCRTRL